MTAPVVTFSIQIGSDGFMIARAVAQRLGYRYYDWHITSAAALAAETGAEASPSLVDRMMSRLMEATILEDELPASMIQPTPALLADALTTLGEPEQRNQYEEVVRKLAKGGSCVIVGHGSQVVLDNGPDVLKVLVVGNFERRALRLAAQQATSVSHAMHVVEELDGLRGDFFRSAYGIDWLNPSLYGVSLNTDDIATEMCVEMVVEAARAGGNKDKGHERDRPALKVIQGVVADIIPPAGVQRFRLRREDRRSA